MNVDCWSRINEKEFANKSEIVRELFLIEVNQGDED